MTVSTQDERKLIECWLGRLRRISRRIVRMEDVNLILAEIVSSAHTLVGTDTASLALLEAPETLVLKHQWTPQQGNQTEYTPVVNPTLTGMLHASGVRRFPHDFVPTELTWESEAGVHSVRSAALVPLRLDDSAIGVLWVGRYDDSPFTPRDLTFLNHLADRAVIAIEHASMAARVQSLAVIEERWRIAREMHDSLAQILGYLGLEMQTLELLVQQGNTDAVLTQLRDARETIKSAQADVRGNILSLRTTLAGDVGLLVALRKFLEEFSIQTGVGTQIIDETDGDPSLCPMAEAQLVRIVQESLTNVRKHARATSATLRLAKSDGQLCVTIADDGVGMSDAVITESQFGLLTMRERADSVGGTLNVRSAPGQGTTVELVLPLS